MVWFNTTRIQVWDFGWLVFFFLKEEEVSEWNFDFFGTFFSFFLEGAA